MNKKQATKKREIYPYHSMEFNTFCNTKCLEDSCYTCPRKREAKMEYSIDYDKDLELWFVSIIDTDDCEIQGETDGTYEDALKLKDKMIEEFINP